MIAWLAMMVATVASSTSRNIAQSGASLKKGLPPRIGWSSSSAVWPA